MKSSAKPEPKARAAAESRDSGPPNGSADDFGEAPPAANDDDRERGDEPAADSIASDEAPSKAKRKPKASRGGSEPNNVRKLRQEAMMSKAELARRAGVSPLTIDRVEAGSPCRMDTKRKILEALGLSPSARAEVWPDIDGG
jgi:DNA-binding XRE family transcriptional regulator